MLFGGEGQDQRRFIRRIEYEMNVNFKSDILPEALFNPLPFYLIFA